MSTELIQVDKERIVIALGRLRLDLQQKEELLRAIGAAQLVSVRRTFREQGSPSGSWVPLSPNTIKRDPKKYGSGHKLLIDKGRLINSISYATSQNGVTIGTNLVYARVHQLGSADRAGAAIGPQARIDGRDVEVGEHSFVQVKHDKHGDKYGTVDRFTSEGFKIKGRRRKLFSGVNFAQTTVRPHRRFQNIPPRPYLVFRPEDPARNRSIVVAYVNRKRSAAGLAGGSQ